MEADLSFLGPVFIGGIALRTGSGRAVVSVEPVSIWTTCLKEEVSAWTKVVGYGLFGSDLVMGMEGSCDVGGGGRWRSPLLVVVLLLELLELWLFGDGISDGFWFSWTSDEFSISGSVFVFS